MQFNALQCLSQANCVHQYTIDIDEYLNIHEAHIGV